MNHTQLYKVVIDWLRENVEGDDHLGGYQSVVSLAICDIDTDIKLELAKYEWPIEETRGYEYKQEGATHLVRFLTVCNADLVDGDDFYFRIEDGKFILVNEPDMPAYCGGELDEGMSWVAERANKCATDIGDRE